MKNKILYISIFILLAYVIPLIGDPVYLSSWKLWVLASFATILLLMGEVLRKAEVPVKKTIERLSSSFVFLGFLISQAAIIFEWAYLSPKLNYYPACECIAGFIVMILGTFFSTWCAHTRGQFNGASDKERPVQGIITHGPFSLARYPNYFSAFTTAIGSGMFMQVSQALILTMIILFLAYLFRIRVEEKARILKYGHEYADYQSRTARFIPFIY